MAEWRVICSCGWTRDASSAWAADSVRKLHERLGTVDAEHISRIEGPPDESAGQQSLTPA